MTHLINVLCSPTRCYSIESVKEALSTYLVRTLPQLGAVDGEADLAELSAALEQGQQKPSDFFHALWAHVQPSLLDCSITDTFNIARGVLRSAELLTRSKQPSGQFDSRLVFCCLDSLGHADATYSPSDELWSLHADVHAALFNTAGCQLASTSTFSGQDHNPGNVAQVLLQALVTFNAHCMDSWCWERESYVPSASWLSTVGDAAVRCSLQVMQTVPCDPLRLVRNLAAVRKGSTWTPRPRLLQDLDDVLTTCITDSSSLGDLSALLSPRASLGPIEADGKLLRRSNNVVLMHSARASDGAGKSQQLAQLRAQASLLQVAHVHGGLDSGVLINSACLNLALAGEDIWSCPEFLSRTYPALCEAAAQMGALEDGSDLQPDRYASSVRSALAKTRELRSLPDHPLNEVEGLAGVLGALRTSGAAVDADLLSSFQAHAATRLTVGVSQEFVRVKHWLFLLQQLADMMVPCPQHRSRVQKTDTKGSRSLKALTACWFSLLQMTAVMAWALVHETAPFGRRADIDTVTQIWAKMACTAVGLPAIPPGSPVLPGVLEVPGLGLIYEKALVSCLAQGRKMDLLMPSAAEWLSTMDMQLGVS
eukprot:364426-Chlamydomonas_euryale.AAC.24